MGRLIFLALLLFSNVVFGQTLTAKVIRIIDGDTMEVLHQNKLIKVRLAHIDCPEKRNSQPYNNNAKNALSDLCYRQQVTIHIENTDRYGRLIAVVVNNKDAYSFQYNEMNDNEKQVFIEIFTKIQDKYKFVLH